MSGVRLTGNYVPEWPGITTLLTGRDGCMHKPESAEMLDLVFSGIRFDPAMIYKVGTLFNMISSTIPNNGQNNFTTQMAASKKIADNSLEKIMNRIKSFSGIKHTQTNVILSTIKNRHSVAPSLNDLT
jgi:hypothetical protein